jgi:hypothetical protein
MTLNIIWATGRDYKIDWESTWIMELLGSIPYKIENLRSMNQIVPNALVVFNHNIPYTQYLSQYEINNIPFSLIHLSDEYINDLIHVYNFKMCKSILRNCYRKECENKVIHFPLGYKYNLWENTDNKIAFTKTCNNREYDWSFAGGMRDNRKETIDIFKTNILNHKVIIETGNSFNNPLTGLNTTCYRELMLNSKFVLCPEGNASVDCFRVYESLECGAIPIVIDKNKFQWFDNGSYWKHIFNVDQEPPFIMGSTVVDNLQQVQELLQDLEKLEEKRKECYNFWINYKNNLKNIFVQNFAT